MSATDSLSVYYNLALFKGIAYKLLLTDRRFFLPSWHPCFLCIYNTYRFSLFFYYYFVCVLRFDHHYAVDNLHPAIAWCSFDEYLNTITKMFRLSPGWLIRINWTTERQKGQVPRKKPNHFQFFKSLSFFSIVIQIFRFSVFALPNFLQRGNFDDLLISTFKNDYVIVPIHQIA